MLLYEERKLLVEYGKKMVDRNLTKGTGGNLSIYNRDLKLMAITPSGFDYFKTKVEDIIIINDDGLVIEGKNKPSSEYMMHLILYKNRKDISAVVHTHSPYATTLSCLRLELPAVHYMIALAGKTVRCSEYATYGSLDLAENALVGIKDRKAVLLANHGLLAGDYNLENAFNIAEEIEYCSELYYRASSIGEPIILPDDEMEKVIEKFGTFKTYEVK